MHFIPFDLTFGIFENFWGFSKLMKFLWNFWDGCCLNEFKNSCITSHLHYNYIFMHFRCVLYMLNCLCAVRFGWVEPLMYLSFHVTCSRIFMQTYLQYFFIYIDCIYVASWHLNESPLCPKTLFVLGHLLLLLLILALPLFDSMMIKPERTFRRTSIDEAFIRNTMLFCQTFPTLTYPLSFTVEVGSHFVTSQSLVPPWSYKSFNPICMESILQYLISSLTFEVRAL